MTFVPEEEYLPEAGGQYRWATTAVSTSAGANIGAEAASPYAKEATR
jgi:hypothetical protein